jgi:hypothetical protein
MIKETHRSRSHSIHLTGGMLVMMMTLLIGGCHKDVSGPENNQYLVSFRQVNLLLLQSIDILLSPLESEYPLITGIKEHASYNVQIYSITYKTQYKGADINASGLVCIPVSSEKFPIISFQNGTNTFHDNAPSVNPLNFDYLLIEAMASNGYIILIPDYVGFGASADQVHPYYQKETTSSTVVDMIHACNELIQNNIISAKSNDNYYLMGYSQGGWATLSTLEKIEKSSQADISILAASCGAGAYDLIAMSHYVLAQSTFPGPLYLPYFIYSEQIYGTLADPLGRFFREPYASAIPGLFDGTHTNGEVNAGLNDTIASLLTSDMIENFSTGVEYQTLRNLLTENSVSAWHANALLRFYHGTDDLNVPPGQSQAVYDNFISAGSDPAKVGLYHLTGLTHETGVIPWGINTIAWFNELEGK